MPLLVHFLISLQSEWCVSVSTETGHCHLLMLGGTFELHLPSSPSLAGTPRKVFWGDARWGRRDVTLAALCLPPQLEWEQSRAVST